MSASDKAQNKAQEVSGKLKKTTGEVTGDEHLEASGRSEQSKGNAKQAVEKVKDFFKC